MSNVLTLETNKYAIRLDNFEGPLDLLCHLVDKNKMDINEVNISKIADQYIEHLNTMKELNLEIASEFIVMASTLLYIKSKSLLPNEVDDEAEITEEELIRRIIEYKKYKEISIKLRDLYNIYNKRCYKLPDKITLENRSVEEEYDKNNIIELYREILKKLESKVNPHASNIEKIAVSETITVSSKVKDIFRELMKKQKFVFNKLCMNKRYTRGETVVAFTGLLELTRRQKVIASQTKTFGDITVEKAKRA